jgi:hypothetical protein
VNVTNLFDQQIVTDLSTTPYRDRFLPPGLSANGTNAQLS